MIRRLPQLANVLVALLVACATSAAQARQVLLVTTQGNNAVSEYDATTGGTINPTFIAGLNGPYALSLDRVAHLFVGLSGSNTVGEYDAATGAAINAAFANGPGDVLGNSLALDGNSHVFAVGSRYGPEIVGQYNSTTGAMTNSVALGAGGVALAADRSNHLFAAESTSNLIIGLDATTLAGLSPSFVISQGLNDPLAMLLDANNHLFVANYGSNTVGEYDATTGAMINATFIRGNRPYALAFDGNNHIFVGNYGLNAIGEYDATTGAAINPSFITGINGLGDINYLAPVPEPSSLLLVGVFSVAGVLRASRRRRRR